MFDEETSTEAIELCYRYLILSLKTCAFNYATQLLFDKMLYASVYRIIVK